MAANANETATGVESGEKENCCVTANVKVSGLPADKLNLAVVAGQGTGIFFALLTTFGLIISDIGFMVSGDYSILLYAQITAVFCSVPWILKEWKDKENPFAPCCPCVNTPEQKNCARSSHFYSILKEARPTIISSNMSGSRSGRDPRQHRRGMHGFLPRAWSAEAWLHWEAGRLVRAIVLGRGIVLNGGLHHWEHCVDAVGVGFPDQHGSYSSLHH